MASFPGPIKPSDTVIPNQTSQAASPPTTMQTLFTESAYKEEVGKSQSLYGAETRAVVEELQEKMASTLPPGAGASVLVAANGEKPRHIGLGTTSVQGGQPVDINTAAVIGSGAKMFTGLLSKVLEEKGILSLQTKLADVLEERHFAIFRDPKAAKDITLEMLLSHTSGVQFHADIERNEREKMSWDQILDGMCEEVAKDPKKKIQLTGVPGDGVWSYSNQISLAAIFIEKAYNKAHPEAKEKFTYAAILEREVLVPLGMSRTSFVKPQDNVLRAYRNDKGIPTSEDADIRDPVHQPAGGLWSTAADIGKLAEAFATAFTTGEGLKSADGKTVLLGPEALSDFLRPRDVRGVAAIGIDIVGPFFGKGGEISTYDFKFSFDRETGSYIVSLCNYKNSREFGGEKEEGHKTGYINYVIPTLDEMHRRFAPAKPTSSPQVTDNTSAVAYASALPLHSCDHFYYGVTGIIGMHSPDPNWVNWNGEILPLQQMGKNRFFIVGNNRLAGKTILFGEGHKGNSYLFIESVPTTQKVIIPSAFREVKSGSEEIETLQKQKDLPLETLVTANGTYSSVFGARGALPITVTVDSEKGTVKVSSDERMDQSGHPLGIPMTIASSKKDIAGQLNEVWLVGNFMAISMYQLKLSMLPSGDWQLEVIDFASKDSVDTLLPIP